MIRSRLTEVSWVGALKVIASSVVVFAALPFQVSGLRLWSLQTELEHHSDSNRVPEISDLGNQSKINSFSFCVLLRNPNVYAERIVRTTAILVAGYEQFFLYSPQCNKQDKRIWAERDQMDESNQEIDKQLESLLSASSTDQQAGRAQVTVVGRLIAPGPKRFGHLDQFRMKFVILGLEGAKPVSSNIAWPSIDDRVTSVDQTVREINREFILHVAGAPSYAVIPSELLAPKFRFVDADAKGKSRADFLATSFTPYPGLIHDKDIEVRLRRDSAVVTGLLVKRVDDSPEEHFRYTVRYVRRGGEWQITAAQLRRQ